MTSRIRFDDALSAFVCALVEGLPPEVVREGVIVRDITGRLAFTAAQALDDEAVARLNESLAERVGDYARRYGAVAAGVREGSVAAILSDPSAVWITVGDHEVRLVDRRLSGGDWTHGPYVTLTGPPTIVFASMKGGVGRSTALVVTALDLARAGRRVLVLDLDLEAPGLGVMLLADNELPPYGALDALVERKIAPLDDALVTDLVASSRLGGGGLLVCPAMGARALENPAAVLSKIGRVYGEVEAPDGRALTVLDQLRELVAHLTRVHGPEIILVDARAGLHELAAATILGLGGEVLLFGLDEPQTWHSYRVLLSQLALTARGASWADALTPVQGKAPANAAKREEFQRRWRELLRDAAGAPKPTGEPLEALPGDQYEWDNAADASMEVSDGTTLAVLYNAAFAGFDPLNAGDDPIDAAVVQATFGAVLTHVRRIVGAP